MSTNPYAAPKAAVADEPVPHGEYIPGGQNVPAARGWNWIADGWTLFKAAPGLWIGIIVVLAAIYFAMMFIPFIGPVAQYLLLPAFMAGIAAGCRAIDDGTGLEFNHLFEGFRSNFGTLVAVGALYLLGFAVIIIAVVAVVGFSAIGLVMTGGVGQDPAATAAAGMSLLLAVLIALALSIPLVMAIWFAPALVTFHQLGAVEAMKASFTGCLRNVVPFLVYGIIGFLLAILASIPLGLGWLVAGPVFAASVYTGYRDIYLK